MIVPVGAASLREAMDMAAAVYEHIPAAMEAANVVTPRVGARGAYEIHGTPIEVMTILRDAVARAQISDKISFAIDVGARDFAAAAAAEKIVPDKTKTDRDDDDDHRDEQKPDVVVVYANDQTAKDLLKLYVDLLATFPIATLEDPYWDEDVTAFLGLKEKLDLEALRAAGDLDDPPPDEIPLDLKPVGGDDNCTLQVAGDAACQTPQDLDKYDDQKTINTLTLTLSKGKTVSGCIDLAKKARDLGWGILVAADTVHPETDDTFVAHFAVGVRAGQFKAGGLLSFEQLSKYSELLRIASEDTPPPWLGVDFRASAITFARTMELVAFAKVVAGAHFVRVEWGSRISYLVDNTEDSILKTELEACLADEKVQPASNDFAIVGHRGACLQFPEHTQESYDAAIYKGAGIVECAVAVTASSRAAARDATRARRPTYS
ncbi:hypothetical protein CTAYLR_002561 [Chrysophaeum taylorii]|uniref:phosphopyruvate hydratase n=1 Tax=Chrysophaeum taylorii TaxID=2483200 RepID=A0AAD7UF18_9STRA|nr:hypothetical protein CTAYLR_002561 [Chrysophaeum taylorii]